MFKEIVGNMKDDDELEMLLGEIPQATSSLNLHPSLGYAHNQPSNLINHGYGHASCVTQNMNIHSVHGMYGDELLKHKKYTCSSSSPVSGFSLQSDGSSSSLLSNGGRSFSDIGSPSPPQFDDLKAYLTSGNGNGFGLDFKKDIDSNLVDDFDLSRNFSKMCISNHQESVPVFSNGVQSCDPSTNIHFNYGSSDNYMRGSSDYVGFNHSIPIFPGSSDYGGFNHSVPRFPGSSDYGGFNHSVSRFPVNFDGVMGSAFVDNQRIGNLSGSSRYSPNLPNGLILNSGLSPQHVRTNVVAPNNYPLGFGVSDVSRAYNRPSSIGDSFYTSRNEMINSIRARDAFYSPNMVQMANVMPRYNEENLLHYHPNGRNNIPKAFTKEDSLILQGEGVNYGINRGNSCSPRYNVKGYHHVSGVVKPQESYRRPKMFYPFYLPSKFNSLAKAQGSIYHIAKDQHGCRFLQRMFDEGSSQDVQIIFNEIIDHVVELMMNPFGNYLMQKLLDVCNEEQRLLILLKVTRDPGQLVRISLNTHGTRVVQKLIETLKMRQQISLVISALEPGFLALINNLNGNHVVQRCLQCFTTEDSKFIFVAAAKYCVDIATHQHGCCVLQRCIDHSTGELREALVAEISANGLLLAQDEFGNYVVQFILELKIPSATSKLKSLFEGNYVHLSTQKFSSHVVEKCLEMFNDETRSKIIHELLSVSYFEQLVQDPHANYVIQKALLFSEGSVHMSLIKAIERHKAVSRNCPYSKKIFSHKLLKR